MGMEEERSSVSSQVSFASPSDEGSVKAKALESLERVVLRQGPRNFNILN